MPVVILVPIISPGSYRNPTLSPALSGTEHAAGRNVHLTWFCCFGDGDRGDLFEEPWLPN